MEMLRTQGMDMKKVAGEVIAFAKRATLSKGNPVSYTHLPYIGATSGGYRSHGPDGFADS